MFRKRNSFDQKSTSGLSPPFLTRCVDKENVPIIALENITKKNIIGDPSHENLVGHIHKDKIVN